MLMRLRLLGLLQLGQYLLLLPAGSPLASCRELELFLKSCVNVWSGDRAQDICFLQQPVKCYFRPSDLETLKKKLCFCFCKKLVFCLKKKPPKQTSPSSPANQTVFPKP